jgi:hypothetical protein
MATYLYQASYANESWATQLRERQNVLEWLRPLAAALKVEVKDA